MTKTVISEEVATVSEEGNKINLVNAKSLENRNTKSKGFKYLDVRNSKSTKESSKNISTAMKATYLGFRYQHLP